MAQSRHSKIRMFQPLNKTLPSSSELESAYLEFACFSLQLLGEAAHDTGKFKFAAVNSQIALELFFKYYYTEAGKVKEITKLKNGVVTGDYVDFAQILNNYFKANRLKLGGKAEFKNLIYCRNALVHRGQLTMPESELAKIVVRTFFFMHAISRFHFGKEVFYRLNMPTNLKRLSAWRAGVHEFVQDLICTADTPLFKCVHCNCETMVSGEAFPVDNCYDEALICLTCFETINLEVQAKLLDCYKCGDRAYLIDTLNPQPLQAHPGKCLECGVNTNMVKCAACEEYFHPSAEEPVILDGKVYCSLECFN